MCEGCGRTLTEIAAWSAMSGEEKKEVVQRSKKRLNKLRQFSSKGAGVEK